jgi:hypothetical protein
MNLELMGRMRNAIKILVGKPEKRDSLEELGIDGIIILKRSLKELIAVVWIRVNQLKVGESNCLLLS